MPLSELNDLAENLIAPVALDASPAWPRSTSTAASASRCACTCAPTRSPRATSRWTTSPTRSAPANANTPVGTLEGAAPDAHHPGQPPDDARGGVRRHHRGHAPERRHGAPARTWPTSRTAWSRVKTASWADGERAITLLDPPPARRQHRGHGGRDHGRAARSSIAQMPSSVKLEHPQRPLGRRSAHAIHDVKVTLGDHRRAGGPGDLPLPAPPVGHDHPGALAADLAHRHARAHEVRWTSASTTSRCSASRSPWAWWWTTPS